MELVDSLPWLPGIEVTVMGALDVTLTVGLILRFDKGQLGFSIVGKVPSLTVTAVVDLPWLARREFSAATERDEDDPRIETEVYLIGGDEEKSG